MAISGEERLTQCPSNFRISDLPHLKSISPHREERVRRVDSLDFRLPSVFKIPVVLPQEPVPWLFS